MNRLAALALAALVTAPTAAAAQQEETFDYWRPQRDMVLWGQQAILTCNGLFTSHRTLEQVYDKELAFFAQPVGTPRGGDYEIDWERKAVAIGVPGRGTPVMRAAFREGIGCVILAPDQTFEDIASLPQQTMEPLAGDPAATPWPDGDLLMDMPLPSNVDTKALQAASNWAFEREAPYQVTISLVVVYKGRIIHERYAPGFDMTTRTRTWSPAKRIASTLVGILVDQGRMSLDEPLGFEWLPRVASPETDPRREITLRHVLNMSSGLYPIDDGGLEYATGSGMGYWAGASSVRLALDRALIREPGTFWDYENSETLLAVRKMKEVLGDERAYLEFPRRALLDKIGMRNTLVSTDRFGDFILSSQVYTNARDLARFGLLYLNGGTWNGERIISKEWIGFVRTPAPSTGKTGNFYGGQFWLVPDDRKGEGFSDAYATRGNRGQYTIVVPSKDLVIVRRGLDWGRQGFDAWDLTREVVKAIR